MLNGLGSSLEQLSEEQTFGRYTLLKRLATGGMAEVWLARQRGIERFEKKLVIKRILPKFAGDIEFKEMFLNEARIAAQFSHPNIVQLYDMGEVDGSYYLAMEYVHGQDLGRIVRQAHALRQRIPPHIAIRIIALSCEGLYYAHTRTDDAGRPLKVIHRDISPQNILVGFDGSVKLVDFGIAKAVDSAAMTKSGHIKGKLSYMAPEQATSKTIDHRVDIFAIGLTLYEMLSNTRPLKRSTDAATFMAALDCKIPPLTKVAQVPPELEPIVMRAIAKDRNARYPDARQFGVALERFLVSEQQVAGAVDISDLMAALFTDPARGVSRRAVDRPRAQAEAAVRVAALHPPSIPPLPVPVPVKKAEPPTEPQGPNAAPAPASGPWAPGTPIGKGDRYLIRRKLGEGQSSEVYLCAAIGRPGSEKNVAVKKPRGEAEGDERLTGAFIRETSVAEALSHRNVVRIHDFERHGDTPFYVMEYVRGRSLADVVQRGKEQRKPIPPRLIAWLGEQVAEGLGVAQGVFHLNLWPGNVLLSFDGAVKVTDFGTASRAKPAYLSPEQVRGEAMDACTDLFCLGIVLWEALTSRKLFEAEFEDELRAAVESQTIVPPSLLNFFDVPEALSQVVMQALERDPEQRFQSADEMGRALRRARAAAPGSTEEGELVRYLRELYGDEIEKELELDQATVSVPLFPVAPLPESVEISPVSDPAVWVPIEISQDQAAPDAETVIASDLAASMRSADGDDDGDRTR
ncbi:MAG TPA: serine/threonine-protein kinase [Myxococcaceae bacterium]|jgi:serine/threonine protein kinase